MALHAGQTVRIVAAGAGIVLVFGLMGHLFYSGVQRHKDRGSPSEFGSRPTGDAYAIQRRAAELKDELALSETQADEMMKLLFEHGYAYNRDQWRNRRGEFYVALDQLLDEDQRERLRDWRERRGEFRQLEKRQRGGPGQTEALDPESEVWSIPNAGSATTQDAAQLPP